MKPQHNDILFLEEQQFRQWWLWLLLFSISAISFFSMSSTFESPSPFFSDSEKWVIIFIAVIAPTLPMVLFLFLKLELKITKEGIFLRFFPLNIKFQFFPWETIDKCYIRKYSAFYEFGGWGLRIGLFGKGKLYNVSGDKGLQLEFTSGKKVLIGTKNQEKLFSVLNILGRISY